MTCGIGLDRLSWPTVPGEGAGINRFSSDPSPAMDYLDSLSMQVAGEATMHFHRDHRARMPVVACADSREKAGGSWRRDGPRASDFCLRFLAVSRCSRLTSVLGFAELPLPSQAGASYDAMYRELRRCVHDDVSAADGVPGRLFGLLENIGTQFRGFGRSSNVMEPSR